MDNNENIVIFNTADESKSFISAIKNEVGEAGNKLTFSVYTAEKVRVGEASIRYRAGGYTFKIKGHTVSEEHLINQLVSFGVSEKMYKGIPVK